MIIVIIAVILLLHNEESCENRRFRNEQSSAPKIARLDRLLIHYEVFRQNRESKSCLARTMDCRESIGTMETHLCRIRQSDIEKNCILQISRLLLLVHDCSGALNDLFRNFKIRRIASRRYTFPYECAMLLQFAKSSNSNRGAFRIFKLIAKTT